MSRARVWAVVEGLAHDVPFYEDLLVEGGGIKNVEVIRAIDLEVEGKSAGGKTHALELMRALKDSGSLAQENRATKVDVVFFLDKDDDEYLGRLVDEPHVAYTQHADVEAEIVSHCSLPKALATNFSLTRAQAAEFTSDYVMTELSKLWSEWIALRLASGECRWSDTRFAQPSQINRPTYGQVDEELVRRISARVEAACPDTWRPAVERARRHVEQALREDEGTQLLKGKWIASYAIFLARNKYSQVRKLPSVTGSQLMSACAVDVDYSQVWTLYQSRLGPLLAR